MRNTTIRRFTFLALAALACGPALAERLRDADDRSADIALRHVRAQRVALRLSADDEFSARRVEADELGLTHVRVDQLHRGVPVFGGEMIVHLDSATGEVVRLTDDARRGLSVDTEPSLAPGHALAIANRELMPMAGYSVEPSARLVVWRDAQSGLDALAYHVHAEIENDFETRHEDLMVDAHSGAVLARWDSLETAGTTGTGKSQYSGTVTLNVNTTSTGYEMRDTTRGSGGNTTRNLNHATSGTGSICTDSDNVWGDGANYVEGSSTTAANGQTADVDAHFGVQKTWDYYKLVHGRNGIDGAGAATYSRVHYSSGYDNAFWSDSCFCMTYGDGTSFRTLTAIDVAGHEMSHGVCSRTAGLVYSGESGGLNEANSDIMGTNVEWYSRGGTGGNWTIGEQLASTPLRYMYKPSLDGRSPNCYTSSIGSLNVHYSSGVANRFYYFLVNGTTSLSGTGCNGASLSGIGRSAAEKIWYRALTRYMTSGTSYKGARTACLNAAADLYGSGSANYNAVAAAWSAVSVN